MKSSVTKPAAAVEQCQVKSRKGFFFFYHNWQFGLHTLVSCDPNRKQSAKMVALGSDFHGAER